VNKSYIEIARENDINADLYYSRVRSGMSKEEASTRKPKRYKPKVEYAIYKGDDLLVIGTARECAKQLGVHEETIRWLSTPAARRRAKRRKNPNKATIAITL